MSKDKNSLNENVDYYNNYFKEDLEAIEEELEKSKAYSKIIDTEIDKLSEPGIGITKGSQHYLIEHITNAVQLQTQRQGLRRDRFAIKKAIIDYAAKFADDSKEQSSDDIAAILNKFLKADIPEQNLAKKTEADIDAEIDKKLEEDN